MYQKSPIVREMGKVGLTELINLYSKGTTKIKYKILNVLKD